MKKAFRNSDDFVEVYLKGAKICAALAVNRLGETNSTDELVLSSGTLDDIERIATEDAVIVNNRLYIHGSAHIFSPKSVYKHYSGIDLFNVDWFAVEKIDEDTLECFHAFGWDNERSVPVFNRIVALKDECVGRGRVSVFTNELLVTILPKLILSKDRDTLFETFSKVSISELIKPFNDEIVMTKWFNDNNLVRNVERRLIEKLGESEVSVTSNAYRTGINGFMSNLGVMLGFNYITSAYKDKLGYKVLGNIYDYDFEFYISGYIYSNFEGTNIGVYPSFNEINFKHIDGLIKSLVVEIKSLEKDLFDTFIRDERPDMFMLSSYGCSIDYGLVKLKRELNGFEIYRTDAYGKTIFIENGELYMLTTNTFYVDEDEPVTIKEIEISDRFKSHKNKQIECSKRKVSIVIEDTTVAVEVKPGDKIETYIVTGDSDLVDEQLNYFIPMLDMKPFNLEEAIKTCLN